MEPLGITVATLYLRPLPQRVVVEGISTETAQLEGREEVPVQILALIRVERELQTKVLREETAGLVLVGAAVVRAQLDKRAPQHPAILLVVLVALAFPPQ